MRPRVSNHEDILANSHTSWPSARNDGRESSSGATMRVRSHPLDGDEAPLRGGLAQLEERRIVLRAVPALGRGHVGELDDHHPARPPRALERRMRAAYKNEDPLAGQGDLEALARELQRQHPGAAGSLREGLAETFTVARLGVPPTLTRSLRSTNPIESMIEICRDHSTNVKRWRDGTMVLRWCGAGMLEAKKQFRRVNGHMHLRKLREALDRHVAKSVTTSRYAAEKEVAA